MNIEPMANLDVETLVREDGSSGVKSTMIDHVQLNDEGKFNRTIGTRDATRKEQVVRSDATLHLITHELEL